MKPLSIAAAGLALVVGMMAASGPATATGSNRVPMSETSTAFAGSTLSAPDTSGALVVIYRDYASADIQAAELQQDNFDGDGPPFGDGAGIGNGTGIPGDDATVPNADTEPDIADPDDDNDGIPDVADADPRGDNTYDDNGDGTWQGPGDDGPSWDTDMDAIRDGVEGICPLAVNPNGDDDGDRLQNTWEVCKWGTDPNVVDTDGDGRSDSCEVVDVDGDGDSDLTDRDYFAAAVLDPGFGQDGDFDINGDGTLTIVADVISAARLFEHNFDGDGGPDIWDGPGIGNGTDIPGDDATVPNADSNTDTCDPDDDNDGIPDVADADPRGDITYDDNGDGTWQGPGDDGPSWDINMDAIRDGVEGICPLAVNPNGDDDDDGLLNTWETCKWGTDPNVVDTDGDGLGDCVEACDVNGDGVCNFVGDVILYAMAALLPAFGKDGDFDINGDNVIGFIGDTIPAAEFALIAGLCQ